MKKIKFIKKGSVFLVVASLGLLMFSCDSESSKKNEVKDEFAANKKIERYDNGIVHKVARYEKGKLSGIQELYNTKGELQNTMTYLNGIQHGESVVYFENGNKYRVTPYVNGVIDGERMKFREDGKLWSTQNYSKGMPENNLKEYTELGKLKSIPKLVIDKTYMKDGSVSATITVKGNYKRVKYFEGKLKDGKYFNKSSVSFIETQKRSKLNLSLNSINKSYDIIAQVTTQADNHLFISERISL